MQLDRTSICILGMHRSGTSALARIVNLLGADFSTNLIDPRPDNPRGFWEHRCIVDVHDELLDNLQSSFDDILPLADGWMDKPPVPDAQAKLAHIVNTDFTGAALWGFKDPRTCRLVPLWRKIFDETNVHGTYILMLRDPRDIAQSMAMRDGHSLNKSLAMTLTHLLESERTTRGCPRAVVSYESLLADWADVMRRAETSLAVHWPKTTEEIKSQVNEFLDPNLCHHHAAGSMPESLLQSGADKRLVDWLDRAYHAMGGDVDASSFDKIESEIRAARGELAAWRNGHSPYRTIMKLENWCTHQNDQIAELKKQLATNDPTSEPRPVND